MNSNYKTYHSNKRNTRNYYFQNYDVSTIYMLDRHSLMRDEIINLDLVYTKSETLNNACTKPIRHIEM